MSTPHSVGTEGYDRRPPEITGTPERSDSLSTYLCCLLGGTTAVIVVLLTFPLVMEMAQPLGGLSTTVIAFVLAFTWLVAWAAIEFTWEQLGATNT